MIARQARLVAASARPVAVVFAALWVVTAWAPGEAVAGIVVTRAGGSISVDVEPPGGGANEREFTATVPGAETVDFTESFSGGTGRVAYDLRRPDADTLGGDVEARIESTGIAPNARSEFVVEFTSDLPLRYRFTANPLDGAPTFFEARLDDVVATARTSALGDLSGTIPIDENGVFGQFVREGTLPAGSHRFSVESEVVGGRSNESRSAGTASFEVVAVPLPPAVWAGLSVMGVIVFTQTLRARRAARA